MSGHTEESILDSIPGLEGDTGGDAGSGDDSGGGGHSSAQPTGSGEGGRSSAQPPAAGGADTQQQTVKQRRHDGLVEVPNAQNPQARDLVDPISGRVVAQGGIERRVFEEGQRHARENQQLKQQLQQAAHQLGSSNEVLQEAARLNISPEQHTVALRVMSDFVRDPVKTLEYLVEEVRSKGYQIPFLQNGVSQGMDMNAIARMIDNKMQPITQQQKAAQESARVQAHAKAQLDDFLNNNEEANSNLDVISEMLQARPGMTLDNAYLTMVKWANANGLDHTQSLKQQLAAREQQPSRQQPTTRPLPGPRSTRGNDVRSADGGMYSENASWSDIVRQSMIDSGIQLS